MNHNFDSNLWVTSYYSSDNYNFLVLEGQSLNYTTLNIDFIPKTHNMNVYYLLSKTHFSDVKDYIQSFYTMFTNIFPDTHASISQELRPDYPYIYIAFSANIRGEYVYFDFKTNLTKSSKDSIIPENKKKGGINKLLLAFIITVSVLVIIIIILIIIIIFKNKSNDLLNKVNQVSFSNDNKTNIEENIIMDKND